MKKQELSQDKKNVLRVYLVLKILVIMAMIGQFFLGNWNNIFLCILTLLLFSGPELLNKKLN